MARRAALKASFGFTCECDRCVVEQDYEQSHGRLTAVRGEGLLLLRAVGPIQCPQNLKERKQRSEHADLRRACASLQKYGTLYTARLAAALCLLLLGQQLQCIYGSVERFITPVIATGHPQTPQPLAAAADGGSGLK